MTKVLEGCQRRLAMLPENMRMVNGQMINHRGIIEDGIKSAVNLLKEMTDEKESLTLKQQEAIERLKLKIIFIRNTVKI